MKLPLLFCFVLVFCSYAFAVGTRSTKRDGSGSKGSFDGHIDEVWVFNAGLTPAQVKALKETNKPN